MRFTSNAQWPEGTLDYQQNKTQDDHETKEQAQAVCNMLTQYGFGGDDIVYPIRTWVEEYDES